MDKEEKARKVIHSVVQGISDEDFAFTVEVYGQKYDTYYFHRNGVDGTLAFTIEGAPPNQRLVIGCFTKGKKSEAEVMAFIKQDIS